jgi:hypothetical protein
MNAGLPVATMPDEPPVESKRKVRLRRCRQRAVHLVRMSPGNVCRTVFDRDELGVLDETGRLGRIGCVGQNVVRIAVDQPSRYVDLRQASTDVGQPRVHASVRAYGEAPMASRCPFSSPTRRAPRIRRRLGWPWPAPESTLGDHPFTDPGQRRWRMAADPASTRAFPWCAGAGPGISLESEHGGPGRSVGDDRQDATKR